MRTVFVSSFNHSSLAGISEIIDLLVCEFSQAGLKTVTCENLPTDVVNGDMLLLVDEFSEPAVVEGLHRFRQAHPKVKLICVLTEFYSAGSLIRPPSLNSFKQPLQSLLFDNLLYVFSYLTRRHKLYSGLKLSSPNPVNYLFGSLALCLLAWQKLWKIRTPLKKLPSFHERGYLWFRTIGLLSIREIFDHYFVLHSGISNAPLANALGTEIGKLGLLIIPPPPVKKCELVNPALKFGIDFSGSANAYRQRQLRKFRKLLAYISPGGRFVRYTMRGFDDSKIEHYLSFNPSQSSKWHYSSPMRIIGALKRGQIPIVPKKFRDHPAEELALTVPAHKNEALPFITSLFFYEHFYLDSAWERLEEYRKIAAKNNHETVLRVIGMK